MDEKNKYDHLVQVNFTETPQPNFIAQKNKDWVLVGKKNDFFKTLIDFYNLCTTHNAIVTGKSNYIAGKGLTYDKAKVEDVKQQAKLDKFINRANDWQSWNDILPSMAKDFENFNGLAIEIIFGVGGKPTDFYFVPFDRLRRHKNGKQLFYCDNWYQPKPENDDSFHTLDIYTNQKSGKAIMYFYLKPFATEKYSDFYPIPVYYPGMAAIETDINIDTHHLSNSKNNFSAQGLLTFFNGEPTNEDKRKIKQMFESNYTGPDKAGKTILNFCSENQKGVEFTNLSVSELDKQYETLSKRIQQKIYESHLVTNGILFGLIKDGGALGSNRKELIDSFEHFTKTYIELRQPFVLNVIKQLAKLQDVMFDELYIEPLTPIGLDLPLSEQEVANALTFDEKRSLIADKYKIELTAEDSDKDKRLTLANKLGVGGVQSLMEVIKDTSIAAERKVMIMNGLFGISIKKAQMMIGFTPQTIQPVTQPSQMSEDKDPILEALLSCGQDDNDDEVLEVRCVDFDSEEAAMKFEKFQEHKFADVLTGSVKKVRNEILNLLSADPSIKPETIAAQLGLDTEYVTEQINLLIDKEILSETVGGFFPTGKGLDKMEDLVENVIETEIYTVYKYAERDDVPKPLTESRDFCKELMRSGKVWKQEDIKDISNQFGKNAWTYRGGWYTNPKTKETTPYCRHLWKAITKVRKKGAKK